MAEPKIPAAFAAESLPVCSSLKKGLPEEINGGRETESLPSTNTKGKRFPEEINSEGEKSLQTLEDMGFIPLSRTLAGTSQAVEWFWGGRDSMGLYPLNKVGGLQGATSEGKSTIAFRLIAAGLNKEPFLGYPVYPIESAMILTETDEDQVRYILGDWIHPIGKADNVLGLYNEITADELVRAVEIQRPDILIIDSLTTFAPALRLHEGKTFDWYGPLDTTKVVRFFRRIRNEYDIKLVLLLLHTNKPGKNKDGKRVKSEPTAADVRGSGGIMEQCDVAYGLVPSLHGEAGNMVITKSRKAVEIDKLRFAYDKKTGIFTPLADVLTDSLIIDCIEKGTTSRSALAATLHFRDSEIGAHVQRMLDDGILTTTGAGRATKLVVVKKEEMK